ncbi:hypothetical protein GQ44DRAFT_769815 [Phaeosphaeriaceae sp. PMI808]|nr:hypothetical protein GQ44DRAFT_769815 [Phaeosphaeriaceae sp. PMI808]
MPQDKACFPPIAQSLLELVPSDLAPNVRDADAPVPRLRSQPMPSPDPIHSVEVPIPQPKPMQLSKDDLPSPTPVMLLSQPPSPPIASIQPLPPISPAYLKLNTTTEAFAQKSHYEDFLDRVDEHRWNLRNAREKLVGVRFRLSSQRKEVLESREKAAAQVATAYDLFSRYVISQGFSLPRGIQDALDDAETGRNKLGIHETELQEAEMKYNLEEWKYTEREAQFVDDLWTSTPFNSAPSAPTLETTNDPELTRLSFGASETQMLPTDPGISNLDSNTLDINVLHFSALDLTWDNAHKSSENQIDSHLTAELRTPSTRPSAPMSHLGLLNIDAEASLSINRPNSEADITQMQQNWTVTRGKIEEWLLDALEKSRLQKVQLRNELLAEVVDYDEWWHLVKKHWMSKSPGGTAFHTGDTTVSRSRKSSTASIITTNMRPKQFTSTEIDPGPSLPSPLVSLDQVIDPLEDIQSRPTSIQPSDLVGSVEKEVPAATRSISPYSTSSQLTTGTHASASFELSSTSSIEETQSCASSGDTGTIRLSGRAKSAEPELRRDSESAVEFNGSGPITPSYPANTDVDNASTSDIENTFEIPTQPIYTETLEVIDGLPLVAPTNEKQVRSVGNLKFDTNQKAT